MAELRTGCGFDVHAFKDGRPCIIGGVTIPYERGLDGHSDADVLIHAIIDALLGASNLGDIGILFPDKDPSFKNISSVILLERVSFLLKNKKVKVVNIDSVLVCERPKVAPYASAMKEIIAKSLGIEVERIGIKGKTSEKLGFTGREEGVAAWVTVLVEFC